MNLKARFDANTGTDTDDAAENLEEKISVRGLNF